MEIFIQDKYSCAKVILLDFVKKNKKKNMYI